MIIIPELYKLINIMVVNGIWKYKEIYIMVVNMDRVCKENYITVVNGMVY